MSELLSEARRLVENGARFAALSPAGGRIVSDSAGIAFLTGIAGAPGALGGYAVADRIVGRAAAYLMLRAGVKELYAFVLSEGGREVLESGGVCFSYGTLTEKIINRAGTDICPMEKAVSGVPLVGTEEAYRILSEKISR